MDTKDIKTKIVLLGDSTVGKSSILHRLKFGSFDNKIQSTIGCEFFAKSFNIENEKEVKLLIWDTAGQETFRAFTPSFLRGASVAIIVYSVNSNESFNNIDSWIKEANKIPDISIVIVGNKSDLKNVINKNTLLNLNELDNVSIFGTVSAKENYNIQELFIYVCKEYLKKYNIIKEDLNIKKSVVKLEEKPIRKNDFCCYL